MPLRILFIVPYIPDLVRVRPYHFIRSLSQRGHHVTVLTVRTDRRDEASLAELKKICNEVYYVRLPRWRSLANAFMALPTRAPLQSVYSWDLGLANHAADLVKKHNGTNGFDVIHVEHLRGLRYGTYVKSEMVKSGLYVPVIFDSVDSISLLFRQASGSSSSGLSRAVTKFELKRTEKLEGQLAHLFDRVLVTSEKDKNAISALSRGTAADAISVIRNGVDLNYFCPNETVTQEPGTIVVSGKMSYHANVTMVQTFIEKIMPHVWAVRDDVKVWIVGKDPSRSILALSKDPRVTVTGTVPDIRPYLNRAVMAAAPIAYGVGIQNKVLEAMACAVPVICTPQAASALNAVPGRDLVVADDDDDFAKKILWILADKQQQEYIGCNGRLYVENHHQWESVVSELELVYERAIYENNYRVYQ